MKITIYTIKDCTFSKQEKEYLNASKLVFEEKDLETNKDFLTEMLAISNNFAGTPVTRVEKDDGTISVLKGFTKEEFDTTFGFATTPADNQSPVTAPSDSSGQVNDTPITTPPVVETSPIVSTPAPTPTPVETPVVSAPDPLKSVMDDLQAKSEPFDSAQGKPTPIVEQPTTAPPADSPTIPDFPTK